MAQINLLPHRELRRAQRRREFYVMAILAFAAAAVIVFVGGVIISGAIESQTERNNFIKVENTKLDAQIKEIADLKQDIESLKARQEAVEDLQGDRNIPVHLLDELVKQVPEGIYLTSVKEASNLRVTLVGYAQSNDRVSEMLRNLSTHSEWLETPELVEIKAATAGTDKRRVYQFTMNVSLKRPVTAKDATAVPAGTSPGAKRLPAAGPASMKP